LLTRQLIASVCAVRRCTVRFMRENVLLVLLPPSAAAVARRRSVPLALFSSLCSRSACLARPSPTHWITHTHIIHISLYCTVTVQIKSDTPHAAPPHTLAPLQRTRSAAQRSRPLPFPPLVVMDYDEEQRNEIEALEAIFDADFTGRGKKKGQTG